MVLIECRLTKMGLLTSTMQSKGLLKDSTALLSGKINRSDFYIAFCGRDAACMHSC